MSEHGTTETKRPHLHIPEAEELPGQSQAEPDSWANDQEIDTFDVFVRRFWRGEITPDEFKRFRLQHGVYGQRQEGVHMVRVKIPWGGLTARQVDRLAELAEESPRGVGHITTRQNIQFHFVKPEVLTLTLRRLAEVGLTTREACGNTVRNVTACAHAGVTPDEPFDVTPYADATARFLLRNPMNQNMPRKFKISFSGCSDHCGLAPIHDIGAVAAVRRDNGTTQVGFRLYVGGGLGPSPQVSQLLEDFTPADDLLVTIAAIVRVFDRTGNRDNKNLARLKFVIRNLGMDKFRDLVLKERDGLRAVLAGKIPPIVVAPEPSRPGPHGAEQAGEPNGDPQYRRWWITNVRPQKQAGYSMASVRLTLGDVTAQQLRVLAFVARQFADGWLRTTNQQNLIFRWVPNASLSAVYRLLKGVGLGEPSADRLADITACPGADTCQLGITSSRGLALAIGEIFQNGHAHLADEAGIRIKISGCPNSCGHHHIAGIGFSGGSKEFDRQQVPTYQVFLGASLNLDGTRYARPALKVPAKNAPALVGRLLDLWQAERLEGEKFEAFVERVGVSKVRDAVKDLTDLPAQSEAPDKYLDWGGTERFRVETGPGECAS
ncbi:MAG: nitrite/sulfite reductase [candidate division NC10 bacterium]|nr:nitrite/sulfite reductase [candidate division NC10 bacterium]